MRNIPPRQQGCAVESQSGNQESLPPAANHQSRRYAADNPTRLNGALNAVSVHEGFFAILPAYFEEGKSPVQGQQLNVDLHRGDGRRHCETG